MALSEYGATNGLQTSGTTTHTCSLPSGVSVGDLMVLLLAMEGSSATTPSGWTEQVSNQGPPTASYKIQVFSKVANSSDVSAGFVDVTTGSAVKSCYVCTGYTDAQFQSTTAGSNNSTSSMSHPTHTNPGVDAIYSSWYLFGDGLASPSITIWPADYSVYTLVPSQSDLALGYGSTAKRSTVPSSNTVTSSGASPWRAAGIVVTESGIGGTGIDSVSTVVDFGSIEEASEFVETLATSTAFGSIESVVTTTVGTSTTIGDINANPHTLETVGIETLLSTQFGCVRMVDGFITPIQNAGGSLCLLPPLNPNTGSFWGVVLREDAAVSFEVDLGVESLVDLTKCSLATKGDTILFRYDGTGVFVQTRFVDV